MKLIELSARYVETNAEAQIMDTILHEIAHALVGPGAGHGPRWKAMARHVGAKPTRCASTDDYQVFEPYQAVCPRCDTVFGRARLPRGNAACKSCLRSIGGWSNPASEDLVLQWVRS